MSSRTGDGFTYANEHPSVVDAKLKLDKALKAHERARERADAHSHRSQWLGGLHGSCERYLKQLGNAEIIAFTGQQPKLKRGETHAKAVERCRAERATLGADLHECRSAPRTADESKTIARAEIEELALRGQPNIYSLHERGAPGVVWPTVPVVSEIGGHGPLPMPDGAKVPDSMAVLAWLCKGELIARIEGEIDCIADDGNALSAEDRLAKAISINAALLDSERAEEHFIEQAEAEGGQVERRADCDPRAFLNVVGPPPQDY